MKVVLSGQYRYGDGPVHAAQLQRRGQSSLLELPPDRRHFALGRPSQVVCPPVPVTTEGKPATYPKKVAIGYFQVRVKTRQANQQVIITLKFGDEDYQMLTDMLYTQLERRAEAVACYERAAALEPERAKHYYNIAALQRSLGDTAQAEANFDKAIELDPADWEAIKVRSELRRQTPEDNHVAALEAMLEAGISDPRGEVHVCYALAKELEDLGEIEAGVQIATAIANTLGAGDVRTKDMGGSNSTDEMGKAVVAEMRRTA